MKVIQVIEKTVQSPGYRRAYTPPRDSTTRTPRLDEYQYQRGQRVRAQARAEKKNGLPEADLLRLMQQSGVGRPSTYAATLDALRAHGYLEDREGRLHVSARGLQVLSFLQRRYPFLLDAGFSAEMESQLDALALGRTSYKKTVAGVWAKLQDGQE